MITKNASGALSMRTNRLGNAPKAHSTPVSKSPGAARVSRNTTSPQRPTPEERDKVSDMQELIAAFSKAVNSSPEKLKGYLPSHELTRFQAAINNMGKIDGILGDGTTKALSAIDNLANKAGLGISLGIKNLRQASSKEISQLAEKNTQIIADLMSKIGFSEHIPKSINVKPNKYDIIPHVLSEGNVNIQVSDGIVVRPEDLSNIRNFFNFVENNISFLSESANDTKFVSTTPVAMAGQNDKLEKIASFIKDLGIIKLAKGREISAGEFEDIIYWMARRASNILNALERAYASGESYFNEKGESIPVASKNDLDIAKQYKTDIGKILLNWKGQKNNFIPDGVDPYQVNVDPSNLVEFKNMDSLIKKLHMQNVQDKREPTGAGRIQRDPAEISVKKNIEDDFSISGRTSIKPPLGWQIDLENFSGNNKYWDWLNRYVSIHSFNIHDFRNRSAQNIADYYMNQEAMKNYKNAGLFVETLSFVLQQIFKEILQGWRINAQEKLPDFKSHWDRQMNIASKWNYTLGYMRNKGKDLSKAIGSGKGSDPFRR